MANTKPGAPIIEQSPHRKVGATVYVSVPGPIPVIKARKHLPDRAGQRLSAHASPLAGRGEAAPASRTRRDAGATEP